MAKGLDVHPKYQRNLRWSEVDPNYIKYVWVKVSDGGAAYVGTEGSARFYPSTMVNGAKSRGIPVGGYHYAQLSPSPEAQADILIREVERLGATGVLPALDLEAPFVPDAFAREFGERFCRRIKAHGYRPVVYMNDSFAGALKPAEWDSDPVLWIARYGAKPTRTLYDVHQYTQSGTIAGATVDMNDSYNNMHLNTGGGKVATLDAEDLKNIHDATWFGVPGARLIGNRRLGNGEWAETLLGANEDRIIRQVLVPMQQTLLKAIVDSDNNDLTAAGLAAELVPLIAPQLVEVLREANEQLPDFEITEEQMEQLAQVSAEVFGQRLLGAAPAQEGTTE